ncbi:hypothetical protein L798_13082 [Zootermopsis nevadensis]|uniref:Uncharacterized protein n=1 Tax=Zootermopsis nevadensis TaxID=136037 RepID=A0A067RQD0_ZOONE|nr:hypothetical protein L798_13082 [Zootermopsis nevadensis]
MVQVSSLSVPSRFYWLVQEYVCHIHRRRNVRKVDEGRAVSLFHSRFCLEYPGSIKLPPCKVVKQDQWILILYASCRTLAVAEEADARRTSNDMQYWSQFMNLMATAKFCYHKLWPATAVDLLEPSSAGWWHWCQFWL